MNSLTRSSFVTQAAAGFTSFGTLVEAAPSLQAQFIWKIEDFHKLIGDRARIKQVYDGTLINHGKYLNNDTCSPRTDGSDLNERSRKPCVRMSLPSI